MYRLRKATTHDFEFLRQLNEVALKEYVALTWGWDDQYQRARFATSFDPTNLQIIVAAGEDVGSVRVERGAHAVFLANIALLPRWQRKGIGTAILETVVADAAACGLPVALQVLKVNPARRLYERLGFVLTKETATHYVMRRTLVDSR